ncbi:hypothetical protein ACWDGI_10485 [Streptomyces sp. NPDC001220]
MRAVAELPPDDGSSVAERRGVVLALPGGDFAVCRAGRCASC